MIPDNVETITMTKEDYDRNIEQLLVEKLELEHKYNLMKTNANQLAKRIDKALEYIENTQTITNAGEKTLNNTGYGIRLLEILKGEDKE